MTLTRFMEFIDIENNAIPGVIDGYGAYNEIAIPMPVSGNENLAALIHQIEFYLGPIYPSHDEQVALEAAVTNISKSSMPTFGNSPGAILAQHGYLIDATKAGQGVVFVSYWGERVHRFDPPIMYARQYLYTGGRTYKDKSVGLLSVAHVRIGYTLEKVSKDAFIAALVG
ncbi:hypothetical protein ES703_100246 [subsurface metagenome]